MSADVIVIGGGWGGLTAAAILANNGLEVQVLEATGHLGGRSACDHKDGFIVDYGIHIIGYESAGPCARALREAGHEIDFLRYGKPLMYMDREFVTLPTGTASFLSSTKLSFADKMVIGHGVRRLIVARGGKIMGKSLGEVIPGASRQTVTDFYRMLSSIGLIAPDIEVASAREFSKFLRRAMAARHQVSYPRGGSAQINDALAAKVRESGAIELNRRVKGLLFEGSRVAGVKVHDEELKAAAVVVAVPVQKLGDLAGTELPKEFRRKCAALVPTAGLSLDLCLSKPVSDIDSFFITADPITMGQFTSNIDPSTAPEGKQLATFFYPLPLAVLEDHAAAEAEQKRFVELIEEMFGGIMDHVEWERMLRLKMVDGFEPRVGQTPAERPQVRVEGFENLFLAGDCIGVEGKGGDVAFKSGVAAAHAVLDLLK
jgi:phytoene dehydrogenase-like protein